MKFQLSDSTKARLKGLLHGGVQRLRVAGPPVMRWILGHKAIVVIILLVLYILIPHHSEPDIKGPSVPEPVAAASNPAPAATQPATQPAIQPATQPTTQPISSQYAGDIPLYNPGVEGADPQWSLPAELSGADIQKFIQQVNNLANQYNAANELEVRYHKTINILTEDKTFILFWNRALGPGFRDKNLPLDWYQVVKDRKTGIIAQTAEATEWIFRKSITEAVLTRFRTIQTRLIGGKLLIGDQLFIKAFQAYEDDRFSRYKKLTPQAESIATRSATEFHKELEEQQRSPAGGN